MATASALLVIAACPSAALAQLQRRHEKPAPAPLELLKSAAEPRPGQVRLSVALLRTSALEYAQALARDTGSGSFSWTQWLQEGQETGKLKAMTHPLRMETYPGEPLVAGLQKSYRFIRQKEAARLWDEITVLNRPQLEPEIWNQMLQGLGEFTIDPSASGTLTLDDARSAGELELEFTYSPDPATRPSETWAHPFFVTPRVFFRPWKSRTLSRVPLRGPFVIAAQMEAPGDGQLNTGDVLLLVGAIVMAPDLEAKAVSPAKPKPKPSTGTGTGTVQTWTLDVPQEEYQSWLLKRLSPEGDPQMMQKWLDRAAAGNQSQPVAPSVELLSTSSILVTPDLNPRVSGPHQVSVESRLQWLDPTGFEPSSNRTIFRPCVSEEGTYSLCHSLELAFRADALKEGCLASLTLAQPSQPARWKRWKHAMEGREDDAGNLELAEANYLEREGRTLETFFNWTPGKTLLTSAVLRRGRAQVTFTRYVEDERRPQPPPPPVRPKDSFVPTPVMDRPTPLNFTVWRIETPLHWMHRELSVNPHQPREVADKLIKALSEGQARLSTLTSHTVVTGQNSLWQAAEPVTFYGGSGAYAVPHRRGIYFNMRTVELKMVGETAEIWPDIAVNADRVWAQLRLESSGAPAWRHWGIWQPGVQGTNGTNSGVNRPQFLSSDLEISDEFILSQPQVVAVETIRDAAKPGGPAEALRWCVVRVTAEQMIPHVKSKREPDQVSCVAVVVPLPASVEVPLGDENRELARRLLEEAANGERPVLEMAAVFHPAATKTRAKLNTGVEWHYTNGRPPNPADRTMASVNAPAALPPGTVFKGVVFFPRRVVGTQINFEEYDWTLKRDGAPPQVVTDTFSEVRYKFPLEDSDSGERTTISVERPIFRVLNAEGPSPAPGRPMVKRLDQDQAVVLRVGP